MNRVASVVGPCSTRACQWKAATPPSATLPASARSAHTRGGCGEADDVLQEASGQGRRRPAQPTATWIVGALTRDALAASAKVVSVAHTRSITAQTKLGIARAILGTTACWS